MKMDHLDMGRIQDIVSAKAAIRNRLVSKLAHDTSRSTLSSNPGVYFPGKDEFPTGWLAPAIDDQSEC